MNCPNCKSNNIRTTDNQPIAHDDGIDRELYLSLSCNSCKHEFDSKMEVNENGTWQLLEAAYKLLVDAGIESELVDKIEQHFFDANLKDGFHEQYKS